MSASVLDSVPIMKRHGSAGNNGIKPKTGTWIPRTNMNAKTTHPAIKIPYLVVGDTSCYSFTGFFLSVSDIMPSMLKSLHFFQRVD